MNPRFRLIAPVALVGLLALGCGGGESRAASGQRAEVPATAPTAGGQGEWSVTAPQGEADVRATGPAPTTAPAASCPMLVPAVSVTENDVAGGAALTFTTTAGDESVDDLRARVRSMAARAESHGGGGMHRGATPAGPMPATQAEVVDVANGARIELRAVDAREVDALRDHVREHAERMRDGTCPMMRGEAGR